MKNRIRLGIGLAVSFFFLYLAMRGIDWPQLWDLFRSGNYIYLIPVFVLIAIISGIRAIRWHLLMERDPGLTLTEIFHLINIGYLFNNILPAKAGEAARGYLAGRKVSGGLGQAVSTILIERLLDVLSVVVLLAILLPLIELPTWAVRGGMLLGGAALGGMAALLVVARVGPRAVDWLWRIVGRLPLVGHPKVREGLIHLAEGFAVLTRPRRLVPVLLTTAAIWLGYAAMNRLMMYVFGMEGLPLTAAALVLCFTGLSMVVPSSPGAIGPFEWAGVQALALFAVEQSAAFGYTLGLHLFTNLSLIALGIIGLISEGVSYGRITQVVTEAEEPSLATPQDIPVASDPLERVP
jgi:glycosyltransferase 2 family protein